MTGIVRIGLTAILLIAIQAVPAQAAFPGQNGRIAFERYRNFTSATGYQEVDIYTVNSDGTGETRLTQGSGKNFSPAWSPDGQKIAFVSTRNNATSCSFSCSGDIYTMNPDGTGQTRLTTAGLDQAPAWSPDGQKIVFDSAREAREIWVMNADGSGATRITDTTFARSPDWSPDGQKIAFSSWDPVFETTNIYTMNPDGTDVALLADGLEADSPDWSPGGTELVYSDLRSSDSCPSSLDDCYRLLLVRRDGTLERPLRSPENTKDFAPAWSPDGTRITFQASATPAGIATVRSNGLDFNVIVPRPSAEDVRNPDWQTIVVRGYPRPKAATPIYAPLVLAYKSCSSAATDKLHAPPKAFASCTAVQTSDQLTVGTADSNTRATNSTGYLRMVRLGDHTAPPDDSDVRLVSLITDVRNEDLSDYGGELRAELSLRITDKLNSATVGDPGPGTVVDTTFAFTIPCAPSPDATIGSPCSLDTTADTVLPGIAPENRRAIWETDQVKVYDGGPDGDADTAPNTLFMVQGVFAP